MESRPYTFDGTAMTIWRCGTQLQSLWGDAVLLIYEPKSYRGARVRIRISSKMEALHVGGGRQRASHSQSSTYSTSHSHSHAAAASHAPAMAPAAVAATSSSSESDSGPSNNMRGMDSNLGALCEHVQVEGWRSKAFSDIVVHAMGRTFHLHRLLLSRNSFFRSALKTPFSIQK